MRTSRQRELCVVLVCLFMSALWIDFGPIHAWHTSDSIVMVLVSLYKWTPLYWEQDRLGMFFPLLATPWSHPLDNMLVQGALTTLAGLSSLFLLGWYTVGRARGTVIGALGAIFLVAFCRLNQQFEFLFMLQQNAQAFAISLLGLLAMDRWGRGGSKAWAAGGVVCLFVAHWINPALAFVLGPLLVVRGLCFRNLGTTLEGLDDTREHSSITSVTRAIPVQQPATGLARLRPTRDELLGLFTIPLAVLACMALSRLAADPKPYRFLPLDQWLTCANGMRQHLHVYYHHRWFGAIEITAGIGLLTLVLPAGRQAAKLSLPLVAGLLFAAGVQFVFMSSLEHVFNNHSARYILLSVLLWQAALLGFAAVQIGAVLPVTRYSRALPATLAVAMTLVVVFNHGRPSTKVVRAELAKTLGQQTADILAADCTHVTGDYWHVWPAMFHANLTLADQHSERKVWGIATRSEPTAPQWRDIPWQDVRIAEITGEETQANEFLIRYEFPPVAVREELGTIRVLSPTAPWDSPTVLARRAAEHQ